MKKFESVAQTRILVRKLIEAVELIAEAATGNLKASSSEILNGNFDECQRNKNTDTDKNVSFIYNIIYALLMIMHISRSLKLNEFKMITCNGAGVQTLGDVIGSAPEWYAIFFFFFFLVGSVEERPW